MMLISLPCSKIATAACPLRSLSSCASPDTRGSHAVWKGFSLLHDKLFPEINRQLLMAALGGGQAVPVPSACRGCMLNVVCAFYTGPFQQSANSRHVCKCNP